MARKKPEWHRDLSAFIGGYATGVEAGALVAFRFMAELLSQQMTWDAEDIAAFREDIPSMAAKIGENAYRGNARNGDDNLSSQTQQIA